MVGPHPKVGPGKHCFSGAKNAKTDEGGRQPTDGCPPPHENIIDLAHQAMDRARWRELTHAIR